MKTEDLEGNVRYYKETQFKHKIIKICVLDVSSQFFTNLSLYVIELILKLADNPGMVNSH